MEEEDSHSSSSGSTESLVSCNAAEPDFIAVSDVDTCASDGSTATPDQALHEDPLVWVTYRAYGGGPAIRCTAEPLSLSTLVAKAKVQEDIKTLLSLTAKWPPVPGHGYGPVQKAKALPAGGAYLPDSSWEPMLP